MLKIAVDPSLFIMCRLCLEDSGRYQIAPAVKEQISYCFDIHVEPFDGLPQLICKKCEVILSTFTTTKKKFIEKQNNLKSKIQGSNSVNLTLDQPKTVESPSNDLKGENHGVGKISRKRNACISSSSDSESGKPLKVKRNEDCSNTEIPASWPENYKKQYVCKICNSEWTKIKSLKGHLSARHSVLMKKYSNIFKRHCEVKLHKTDSKHNITGTSSKVMHTTKKITENVDPKYYIMYTTKDSKYNTKKKNVSSDDEVLSTHESSNSSDEDVIVKRRKTKNRLYSRSSNETVVLDTDSRFNTSDNLIEPCNSPKAQIPVELGECIKIDDSSDDESDNGKDSSKTKTDKKIPKVYNIDPKVDHVTINEIIRSCQNKYIKKHHDNLLMKPNKTPTEIANQLKCKILSVGRKIINRNNNINCTPLLRFMEHKNLDVAWFPRSVAYFSQESNYIRIMARLKNFGENTDNETGWTDYNEMFTQYGACDNSSEALKCNNEHNGIHGIVEVPPVSEPEIALAESAVSITDANLIGADTKKLLNANPVANPKQLPKKSALTETKTVNTVNANQSHSNKTNTANGVTKQTIPNAEITSQNNNEMEFCMPIITSTTSLATPFEIQECNDFPRTPEVTMKKNDNQKAPDAPRIKVKPASELMSVETLSRMQEPALMPCIINTKQHENVTNVYVPQVIMTSQFSNINNAFVAPSAWNNDFMILNTVELPNTRTNSPFLYFKRLLQLHNIMLLDTDVELTSDFNCLIKFKVLYKQETNSQQLILCLALFCSKNVFCLKVKDRNHDNLNLSRVSPNWQWEVLKIYKGDIMNKLLNNAQKIGTDVLEFTNTFLCLLQSIEYVKM